MPTLAFGLAVEHGFELRLRRAPGLPFVVEVSADGLALRQLGIVPTLAFGLAVEHGFELRLRRAPGLPFVVEVSADGLEHLLRAPAGSFCPAPYKLFVAHPLRHRRSPCARRAA